MPQLSLFDDDDDDSERAHARHSDPDTSHDAAASVTHLRRSQEAVRQVLATMPFGGTDEDIAWRYSLTPDTPLQSPSGLRTRRKELVKRGLVQNSGRRARLESGRQAIVWELT